MRACLFIFFSVFVALRSSAQAVLQSMLRLPDTGQTGSYTANPGEDSDYLIYAPFFLNNVNGTVTDTVTGLVWQQSDGGEMTFENVKLYCDTLTLGGFTDWRLPDAQEAFSILNHQFTNPATDPAVFSLTTAGYWWTSETQANDTTVVWITNAGGGIGNHPKAETVSAGGIKYFHVRAVRSPIAPVSLPSRFTNNFNGTVTDELTQLTWQQFAYNDSLSWEQALLYSDTLSSNAYYDWRLPNIKELQSLSDETKLNPSVDTVYFSGFTTGNYWSSTSVSNLPQNAWYYNSQFGITSHHAKTAMHRIICVRGNTGALSSINETAVKTNAHFVFPNPFSSGLKTNCPQCHLELYNSQGQLIYKGSDLEAQDFSLLPKGIYFLRTNDLKTTGARLIKD
jgi:hypothetical protein